MGSVGEAAINLGEAALKSSGRAIADNIGPFLKSTEAVISETSIGKSFVNGLKTRYEPEVAKTVTSLLQKGVDPMKAKGVATRYVADKMFGKNKEAFVMLANAVEKESGNPIHRDNVMNALSVYMHEAPENVKGMVELPNGKKVPQAQSWRDAAGVGKASPYHNPSSFERKYRSATSLTTTGRIALPHFVQPFVNNVLRNGPSATGKAIADVMKDKHSAYEFALQHGALAQELLHEYQNIAAGRDTFLSKLIHQPGFSFERKWGSVLSAAAGKNAAIMTARDFFRSGGEKTSAGLTLRYLGQDLEKIMVQKGVLTEEQLGLAAYRSVDETMFLQSELRTPYVWHQNAAYRAMSMYKEFAWNQGKLIKDVFKDNIEAAKHGEVKPFLTTVATMGMLFPMAGYMVKHAENVFNTGHWKNDPKATTFGDLVGVNRKKHPLENEFIDLMAHGTAFGITYGLMRAAMRRSLAGYLGGIMIGLPSDLVQDMIHSGLADTKKKKSSANRQLGRDVANKIPVVGPFVANKMFPKKKR